MSAGRRDREALDLVAQRTFAGCAVVELDVEMLTRRLSVALYGKVRPGDEATYRVALTFFGVANLAFDNPGGAFPESVGITSLELSYSDEADEGRASVAGASDWSLGWKFDGLAYEEHSAVLASLADDYE